jgi:hypothetical protein
MRIPIAVLEPVVAIAASAGFVICASARPVRGDSVNTTIAVSFLVDKTTARHDYKRQ